uniref:Transmembrane protein 177 n=1 Tax=Caligus clemensi TaxID=344056 RepID=C1BZV3_CALCM|nr:Transmembrane protein 177 [Caligus clemensi]
MAGSSRIFSQFFKKNWREYFSKRGLHRPSGGKQNSTYQYFNYLQTDAGRKAMFVGASFLSVGVFVVKILPQTSLTQRYVQGIINKVVQDMELSQSEANDLKVFAANLAEPSAMGSFRFGSVLLGYPPFFNVFSEDDLPDMLKARFGLKVGDDVPEISTIRSREGKSFRDSLYLSDDAKKFAISRELYWALDTPLFVPPALSAITVHLIYVTCRAINSFLPLLYKSFSQRWGMYLGVTFIYYVLHKKSQDFFFNSRICGADKKAAEISPSYQDGGIEYYEKLLKRNAALRTLIPHKRGVRLYNLKGNIVSPLFGSKLTLSQRLRRLNELNNS